MIHKVHPLAECQICFDNVLLSVAKITNLFYPNSLNENFFVENSRKYNFPISKKITLGSNVIIGNQVKIGKNGAVRRLCQYQLIF